MRTYATLVEVRLPDHTTIGRPLSDWRDWLRLLDLNPNDVPLGGRIIVDPNRKSVAAITFARGEDGQVLIDPRLGGKRRRPLLQWVERFPQEWPPPTPPYWMDDADWVQ